MENTIRKYYNVWKNIIIQHSSETYYDLSEKNMEEIDEILKDSNIKFEKNKSLAAQLDKIIVAKLLKLAIEEKDEGTIDMIYKRTRSSMFRYFHHKEIILSYLKLNNVNKAIDVIQYMLGKKQIAYWYAVNNYNVEKYKNYPQFQTLLSEKKYLAHIKLLLAGETINIGPIDINTLKKMCNDINNL